jgi:hypothetical protein
MTEPANKRRVCSFDMAEVSLEGYLLAEEQGEMSFCNALCLCLWAVHFVTNPRRSEEQKKIACELTMPSGERRRFADFIEAAQWSAANALRSDSNPWLANGTTVAERIVVKATNSGKIGREHLTLARLQRFYKLIGSSLYSLTCGAFGINSHRNLLAPASAVVVIANTKAPIARGLVWLFGMDDCLLSLRFQYSHALAQC